MDKILKENKEFKKTIAELKKDSAYYPQVLVKRYGERLYCSTLVRINRDNKWYVVHCVESIVSTKNVMEKHLMIKMMESVRKIEFLYKTTGVFEEVDGSQQSEVERLKERYYDLLEDRGVAPSPVKQEGYWLVPIKNYKGEWYNDDGSVSYLPMYD